MESTETVIIGAGQAGLAMSYHLKRLGCDHIVLERARVAERWRTQRWDSLRFQSPNWVMALPGKRYQADEPDGFATKDEVLGFIESYTDQIQAPLATGVDVQLLKLSPQLGLYLLKTNRGSFCARNVVVATGPYQRPRLPSQASLFPTNLMQLHSSAYRNPGQIPEGGVLIVGSGASGCQIAEDLRQSHKVYLCVGRHSRAPRRYREKDLFSWRKLLGQLDQKADIPSHLRPPTPLITGVGGGRDIDLRAYAAGGITLLGRLQTISEGRIVVAPDLRDNLRKGDESFTNFTRAVDRYLEQGDEEQVDKGTFFAPSNLNAVRDPVMIESLDLRKQHIRCVIWATGYEPAFDWMDLPIFDRGGWPVHRRGITSQRGLYFLGLPWLSKASSSFLCGVGEDAEHLARNIAKQ